jgi:hypothetical protein
MFCFGLLLLASWAGWGAAVRRLAFPWITADRALDAGWGLAFTLLFGGLLNLVGGISRLGIVLFVSAGVAFVARDSYGDRQRLGASARSAIQRMRERWLLAAAVGALAAALTIFYAASICSTRFNDHDDLQGYFVFPAKMMQTGALGPDPYSERRILSLGSMGFLHALVLSMADPKYTRIVDPGISLLLGGALLAGFARLARAPSWAAILAAFVLVLIPPPGANVTSAVTGLCLFLTLFLTLCQTALRVEPGAAGISSAVPISLTAAALCSLKTTHVPATLLLIVAVYSIRACTQRRWTGVIRESALIGALTLLFLAPWMISLYQSNGTLLFPLLGRGFHGSAYGTFWTVGAGLTASSTIALVRSTLLDITVVPLLILAAAVLLRSDLRGQRLVCVGWAAVVLVSRLLMSVSVGGAVQTQRYSYAFWQAATLTLLVFAFPTARTGGLQPLQRRRVWSLGALAMAVLAAAELDSARAYCSSRLAAIRSGVEDSQNPRFMQRYVRRYAAMQQAIPENATVLTRLQYPFLLDFKRNRTFIADYPGGSSPPPGMPFFLGGEHLAAYLCRQGIRYVAYSYATEAGFYDGLFRERLDPRTEPWARLQASHTQDFQRNLAELGQTRLRMYDDGDVFVLDLSLTANGQALGCIPT